MFNRLEARRRAVPDYCTPYTASQKGCVVARIRSREASPGSALALDQGAAAGRSAARSSHAGGGRPAGQEHGGHQAGERGSSPADPEADSTAGQGPSTGRRSRSCQGGDRRIGRRGDHDRCESSGSRKSRGHARDTGDLRVAGRSVPDAIVGDRAPPDEPLALHPGGSAADLVDEVSSARSRRRNEAHPRPP
jgi:hypothetical protein